MSLFSLFKSSAAAFPNHNALWVNNQVYTYQQLLTESTALGLFAGASSVPQVGILASRSLTAYSGILGILSATKAYVPLNPSFPTQRNAFIATIAALDTIIVGAECMEHIEQLAPLLPDTIQLCFPGLNLAEIPPSIMRSHTIWAKDKIPNKQNTASTGLAYILFTSGSTGVPKGVPIQTSNVQAYLQCIIKTFNPECTDKFSQSFDLTFDLSVHDLFVCWSVGACLYAIPEKVTLAPARFIKEHELTFWFSVPSVAQFMDRFKMLKPNAFPSLKHSFFCGEPLSLSIAQKWKQAAPQSLVTNIYGPTESTIGITHYTLPQHIEIVKHRNHIVSIGKIFMGQNFKIQNNGELWLQGSQVCQGYWKNEDKTQSQFELDAAGLWWYKTGDIVETDAAGDLFYLGRTDFQVKIRGYRIELEEINHAIQQLTHCSVVFSMPWPMHNGIAENIFTFIDSDCLWTKSDILKNLSTTLPDYMIPKDIIFVQNFPLNSNGKIDKLQLLKNIT